MPWSAPAARPAVGVSANRIMLLRDADGDGVAETREVFLHGPNQPFGMALMNGTFYVGNTDALVSFPYTVGANRITAPGQKLAEFKPRWALDAKPAAQPRWALSGSVHPATSLKMGWSPRKAEFDLASGQIRIFASGLRNAVGMAWEPNTGALWTVVNERDGLGDDTPRTI
jgi:glucose/arabinose dehydrogenase